MITLLALALQAAQADVLGIQDYFPLAKGLAWEYEKSSTLAKTDVHYTLSVRDQIEFGGEPIWRLTIGEAAEGGSLYRFDAKGIYMVATGDTLEAVTPPLPLLLSPLRVGAKWKWSGKLPISGGLAPASMEAQVQGTEPRVVLGKDTDCLRVQSVTKLKDGRSELVITRATWYAPGIGIAYETTTYDFGNDTLTERVKLTKFTRPEKP